MFPNILDITILLDILLYKNVIHRTNISSLSNLKAHSVAFRAYGPPKQPSYLLKVIVFIKH